MLVPPAGMLTPSCAVAALAPLVRGSACVGALALGGFLISPMRPAFFRGAIGVVPRQYEGTTVGTLFTTQALFSTLMPLIGGGIADRVGVIAVFYLIPPSLVGGNLALLAGPGPRRPGAPPPGGKRGQTAFA